MKLAKLDKHIAAFALSILLALACVPSLAFAEGSSADESSSAAAEAEAAAETEAAAGEAAAEVQDDSPSKDSASASKSEGGKVKDSAKSKVESALERGAASDDGDYDSIDADSAGTVFTFTTPISNTKVESDLYWAGDTLGLFDSRVGNDVLAFGREVTFSGSNVDNDVRVAGQEVTFADVVVQDNVNIAAFEVEIDSASAATGYYVGGGAIDYEGTSKRFIAYGQTIYFDGVVEGDVTLSAQDIVIGPNAQVTGTLDIRSGQSLELLEIPPSAQIAHIDTTLNQPNTIDQITQIRAMIAPYFQVGSMLFIVVSFILLGLAMLWGFGHKLTEANRLVRHYPLAMLVLGCIALMLMFVAVSLGALLIFTIPFAAVVLLILLVAAIVCVPFTGSSLMLMLRRRMRPSVCVIFGTAIGGCLVFVPYVNAVVFIGSMIYFVGYLVNIAMFGHDREHDASFHMRESDEDAPGGKASGILPTTTPSMVASPILAVAAAGSAAEPAIGFDEALLEEDLFEGGREDAPANAELDALQDGPGGTAGVNPVDEVGEGAADGPESGSDEDAAGGSGDDPEGGCEAPSEGDS